MKLGRESKKEALEPDGRLLYVDFLPVHCIIASNTLLIKLKSMYVAAFTVLSASASPSLLVTLVLFISRGEGLGVPRSYPCTPRICTHRATLYQSFTRNVLVKLKLRPELPTGKQHPQATGPETRSPQEPIDRAPF